ncbi:MAG: hypothetical protein Q8M29_00160 [Bacteroidota bacterium]|nr:hypothetical protein [Bacteroidota bacterium]
MDLVQTEKILINELVEIYSDKNFLDELEIDAKSIEIKLKTLIIDKGEEYGLISKNSVRDLKYFSLVHRIKEPDSLKEKFYRSNLLQTHFKDFKFKSGADVKRQKNLIKLAFKKCDDIIGVKILTDLNQDCKKILSILRSNEAILKSQHIVLDEKDLAAQPTIMKNGLEIYKIKGTISNDQAFELQIKSKIVSAWGDMEHSIFYKDYFVSPVRETTQATMNHIGKLLFQIDDFLVSVRNANKEFKSNSKAITFLSWFDDNYSKKITEKLGGIGYKIDSFSEALFYIHSNKRIVARDLQIKHFTHKANKELNKQYIKIRNKSYDLKIFESVVFGWLWTPAKITKENIDSKLQSYFSLLFDFLHSKIKIEFPGLNDKEIHDQIENYISQLLKYQPSPNIFLSPSSFIKHYNFMIFVNGELEIIDIKNKRFPQFLDLLFLNIRLEGNYADQISNEGLNDSEIKLCREVLSNLLNAIKLKEKINFKKERDFIQDIITILK